MAGARPDHSVSFNADYLGGYADWYP